MFEVGSLVEFKPSRRNIYSRCFPSAMRELCNPVVGYFIVMEYDLEEPGLLRLANPITLHTPMFLFVSSNDVELI